MNHLQEQNFARPRNVLRRVFAFFWLTLAVAAMVLAGFHVHYAALKPSPYDLRVLGQTEWLPGTEAAVHLRVSRHDGGPERGVPVTIELAGPDAGRRVRLAALKTGDYGEGIARFRLPDWPDGSYQLMVTARPAEARSPETVTQTITLNHSKRLMISTDKPVYQPGRVIHVRGLALRRPDLKPVANQVMAFSVTDPRGIVVFRVRGATSRFGIGSADCPLTGELIDGKYQVECSVGETTDRATVEVRRDVPPRFQVAIILDQPYYQPGQLIKGRVQAGYVTGKPVADGAVTVALESTDVATKVLQTLELRTDATGAAVFELPLPATPIGSELDSASERVAITVMVRDPAGQTQVRTEPRVVAEHPIRIEVIPDAGALVKDLPNTIHLLVTTLDGRPVRARLTVSGLDQELNTSELGVTSFEVNPQSNKMRWTIQATDDQGRIGRRQVLLTCGSLAGDYLFRTDKVVYDGGEPVRVTVLASGADPVFIDLVKDGQTVMGDTIEIAGGRGERTIDLPPELFGTVVVHAYRYVAEGLPVQQSRVIHVRPARALTITATMNQAEYRPGERALLSIVLTDEHGKPAPGAISLAAVGGAAFGVRDRRFGLERTFFTLEPKLLKPIYEIEDWSPYEDDANDLVRAAPPAERARFEHAFFARAAQGPSPHSPVVSSYEGSVAEFESIRFEALQMIGLGWAVLLIVALVGGLARLFLDGLRSVGCLATIAIIIVTWNVLVPALQSAIEASRRSQLRDIWKQIGLGRLGQVPVPKEGNEAGSVRVGRQFRESLFWRPELITDDQGRAHVNIDLADSITNWRVSMGAVSAEGRLGAGQAKIRVVQPSSSISTVPPR